MYSLFTSKFSLSGISGLLFTFSQIALNLLVVKYCLRFLNIKDFAFYEIALSLYGLGRIYEPVLVNSTLAYLSSNHHSKFVKEKLLFIRVMVTLIASLVSGVLISSLNQDYLFDVLGEYWLSIFLLGWIVLLLVGSLLEYIMSIVNAQNEYFKLALTNLGTSSALIAFIVFISVSECVVSWYILFLVFFLLRPLINIGFLRLIYPKISLSLVVPSANELKLFFKHIFTFSVSSTFAILITRLPKLYLSIKLGNTAIAYWSVIEKFRIPFSTLISSVSKPILNKGNESFGRLLFLNRILSLIVLLVYLLYLLIGKYVLFYLSIDSKLDYLKLHEYGLYLLGIFALPNMSLILVRLLKLRRGYLPYMPSIFVLGLWAAFIAVTNPKDILDFIYTFQLASFISNILMWIVLFKTRFISAVSLSFSLLLSVLWLTVFLFGKVEIVVFFGLNAIIYIYLIKFRRDEEFTA